jgi:rSAM/selenodomain-associated transferase 1
VLFPNDKLIIFAKAPIPGQVKKRLIPVLGEQGAAKLHQEMLEQKLRLARDNMIAPVDLYCWPDANHPHFLDIQSRYQLQLHAQQGGHLGERMADAMLKSISEQSHAVLIGTDSPPLDKDYIVKAFQELKNGADAVIGPAEDGGYILIGLSRFDKQIFEDIKWGGEKVYSQTISKLEQLGYNYVELVTLWDVDRPNDLERLGDFYN